MLLLFEESSAIYLRKYSPTVFTSTSPKVFNSISLSQLSEALVVSRKLVPLYIVTSSKLISILGASLSFFINLLITVVSLPDKSETV